MTVVADLSVPTSQFALRESLAAAPRLRVEFERIVTHSQEWIMPFLWVTGEDIDLFDQAIHEDRTVDAATLAETFDQDDGARIALYQITWSDEIKQKINTIFDRAGTLVEAVGGSEQWELKVRFHDHNDLSTLQSHFDRSETGFSVNRIYTSATPGQAAFNLTAPQRDALVTALELGYYDVPRETTMQRIATALDVSTNALSERLRRGTANLVRTTLTVPDSTDETPMHGSDHSGSP